MTKSYKDLSEKTHQNLNEKLDSRKLKALNKIASKIGGSVKRSDVMPSLLVPKGADYILTFYDEKLDKNVEFQIGISDIKTIYMSD